MKSLLLVLLLFSIKTNAQATSTQTSVTTTSTTPTSTTTTSASSLTTSSPSASASTAASHTSSTASASTTTSSSTSTSADASTTSNPTFTTPVVTSIDGTLVSTVVTVVGPSSSTSSSQPTSSSSAPAPSNSTSGSLSTGSIIGLSVAGGVTVIGLIAFFVWKFTRKRFSDFDDGEAIKWPDLNNPGRATSDSHPLPVHNTGRSGFDTGSEHSLSRVDSNNYSTADLHANPSDPYAVPPLPHLNPNQPYRDEPNAVGGPYYDPYRGPIPGTIEQGGVQEWSGESYPMIPMNPGGRMSPGPNTAYSGDGRRSPGVQAAYGRTVSPGPQAAYAGRMSPGPQPAYGASTTPVPPGYDAYSAR